MYDTIETLPKLHELLRDMLPKEDRVQVERAVQALLDEIVDHVDAEYEVAYQMITLAKQGRCEFCAKPLTCHCDTCGGWVDPVFDI
jgi:tRNA uridine 5-carbamoylmethylation protein Kti12